MANEAADVSVSGGDLGHHMPPHLGELGHDAADRHMTRRQDNSAAAVESGPVAVVLGVVHTRRG